MGGLSASSKDDVAGVGNGFAPGGYNRIFRNDSRNTIEGLIGKGALDDYLPYDLRFSTRDNPDAPPPDMNEAADYLKDKIRSGEKVIPYDAQVELDQRAIEAQYAIEDTAQELSHDEINAEFQFAADEERENARNAQVFDATHENGGTERGAGAEARTSADEDEPANILQSYTPEELRQQAARAADTSIEDRAAADRASEVPLTLATQSAEKTAGATQQSSMFTPDGRATVAAESNPSQEQQAASILDRANVTGKDRLDIMRDFRDGKHTLSDLEAAYPAQAQAEQPTITPEMSTRQKEEILGHLVRDKIIAAPSFPALRKAVIAARKSIALGPNDAIEAGLQFLPRART